MGMIVDPELSHYPIGNSFRGVVKVPSIFCKQSKVAIEKKTIDSPGLTIRAIVGINSNSQCPLICIYRNSVVVKDLDYVT